MTDKEVRILMIEDDPAFVDLVRLYLSEPDLEGFACDVDAAGSLKAGLEALERRPYAAVLIDLGLPDSQGLAAVAAVVSKVPHLPVLVLTGENDPALAVDAMRRGAQDFLVKSDADARWLRRAVRYAIERADVQRLNAEVAERRRLDELKDQWIAVLSHELRTPLTVVKGVIVDMCEGREEVTPHQRLLLMMARRHTDRIVHLVANLLDLSRLESGRARIERRAFEAAALAKSVASDAERAARERGVTIAAESAPDAPSVVGDPDLFVQLVVNLVDNATRFARSRVAVRSGRGPGGEYQLTVADDGEGIPAEKRAVLFTRFCQLERKKDAEGYQGTGLGLAICKEIVNQHRGRIEALDAPGGGTAFLVTLPAAVEAPPEAPKAERPSGGRKPRLVVVDDEPDFVRILEMWLKPHYEVTSFTRSRGVADRIRELSPDLVLLDVHMSEESGFKVCRRLKSEAATAGIPVVFLSGSKSNEDVRLHSEVGGARYLMKPIARQALIEALAAQLHAPAGA